MGRHVRKVRAVRCSAALFGLSACLLLVQPKAAQATFVCDNTPGVDPANATCINTGTDPDSPYTQDQPGAFDLTVKNLGSSNGIAITTVDGNALVVNSQSVSGDITAASSGLGNVTIQNFGSVSGIIAATANGTGNATSINSGTALGIYTQTDNGGIATTVNSGTVSFITSQTVGGGDSLVTNSGNVSNPSGPGAIQNQTINGGNATTINSGTVSGGIATFASLASGDGNATLINYGTIVDTGAITVAGLGGGIGNATTINYGTSNVGLQTIAMNGDATNTNYGVVKEGILSETLANGNAVIFNSGRVYGVVEAYADGFGAATISNSGLIDGSKTPDGVAIDLRQNDTATPTTLNLLTGSRIIGSIFLNGDVTDPFAVGSTVNIFGGRNVSSVLSFGAFDTCSCGPPAFVGGLIDTGAKVNIFGGSPYVVSGNTVAILDPTSFAAQDRNVLDFTRTVMSAASSRLTSPVPISGDGSAAIGFAPSGNVARDMANDAFANIPALSYAGQDRVLRSNPNFTAADGTSVWAQGFGGVRVQNADGPNLRSVNQFYGGMIGLDKMVRPDMRLGGFAGGGTITSQIDMNSGRTTSDTGFGGIYGRYAMNRAFLDFALLAGGSSNNVKRTMTNNLAVGGYEYANANYSGWFISPELAYGIKHDLTKDWTLTPTARVRYLAANFGGYQESGSSSNLTAAGRTTHNFEERGELVFTRTTSEREGSRLQINATLGAVAWQRAGGDGINTVLLGQAFAFATPGKSSVFGGYVGGGFNWLQASGFSVFGAAEVTAMSDSSHTITGHGGVKLAF